MVPRRGSTIAVGGLATAAAWFVAYRHLATIARTITARIPGLEPGSPLASAVEFFLYEAPKVLLLLVAVVFGVGIVRSFFTPERTRALPASRRDSAGYVFNAVL